MKIKKINDKFGYYTGDHILRPIAHRIQDTLRTKIFPFRIGSKLFPLILIRAIHKVSVPQAELLRGMIKQYQFTTGDKSTNTPARLYYLNISMPIQSAIYLHI